MSMPFVPDVKADLREYIVAETMKGIFHYVAQEEVAIRANPAKRTLDSQTKCNSYMTGNCNGNSIQSA
jgi:hypothetical protein